MSEEQQTRKGPKGPDDTEWICPFSRLNEESQIIRRKDIADLSNTFAKLEDPLGKLITSMQEQNVALKRANRVLTLVVWCLLVLAVAGVAGIGLHFVGIVKSYNTAGRIDESVNKLADMQKKVEDLVGDVEDVKDTTDETQKKVDEVREEQDAKPQLELVPETDPVKARRAPVKLRVKAPVKANPDAGLSGQKTVPSSTPPSVAEIPLTTDSF